MLFLLFRLVVAQWKVGGWMCFLPFIFPSRSLCRYRVRLVFSSFSFFLVGGGEIAVFTCDMLLVIWRNSTLMVKAYYALIILTTFLITSIQFLLRDNIDNTTLSEREEN